MKYVNIIAFLAMVVGFTLWSMYEQERKHTLHEDFDTQLFAWEIAEEGGEATYLFHNDTLQVIAPHTVALWNDEPLTGNYRINLRFKQHPMTAADSRFTLVWGSDSITHNHPLAYSVASDSLAQWHSLALAVSDTLSTLQIDNLPPQQFDTPATGEKWGIWIEHNELWITELYMKHSIN